jgi:transcriptional regulator with XRE-family HTH domain
MLNFKDKQMNQINAASVDSRKQCLPQQAVQKVADSERPETAAERVVRLCASEGGAFPGWLCDEARRRNQQLQEMAKQVGVTYGYISQLRNGIRRTEDISHNFAVSCARYLGVPAIVVKLVSGSIRISDFAFPGQSEEQLIDRAIRTIQDDPQLRAALPRQMVLLPLEVKKVLVAMYAQTSSQDVFGLHELPETVRWLQRAAVLHVENEFEAVMGHRDTSAEDEFHS